MTFEIRLLPDYTSKAVCSVCGAVWLISGGPVHFAGCATLFRKQAQP